jgi:serine/threonine protein kinase
MSQKGDFDWAPAVTISDAAKSFVERCLEKDPAKR